MAKTGSYFHQSLNTDVIAGVGTSFDKTKAHDHDLINNSVPANLQTTGPFLGYIQSIHLRVGNIVGGSATPTITFRLCCDPNGDLSVVPDTDVVLAMGLTDTNSGVGAAQVQIPNLDFLQTGIYFLMCKIDQGTCDLTASCVMWSE